MRPSIHLTDWRMEPGSVAAMRLQAQCLYPKRGGTVAERVRQAGGIQAQEIAAALWSIGTRTERLKAADVELARIEQRSIVLTWAMRGTRHFVAAADLGWLLPLFGRRTIAANQRRYRELGLN